MKRKNMILTGVAVAALMIITAGASAFVATRIADDKPVAQKTAVVKPKPQSAKTEKITWNEPARAQPQPVQQKAACNDSNIVGTALGAVGGGLVGSQIGGGKGKDLATIGGAVAGGFAGHQFIPTHNALCP